MEPLRDEEIRLLFEELDQDKSGHINSDELDSALKRMRIPRSYHQKIMAKGDLDGDGLINLQEFIEYVKAQEEDLLTLFKKLDLNGDGVLCEAEVSAALESLGVVAATEDVHDLMEALHCESRSPTLWPKRAKTGAETPAAGLAVDYATFRKVAVLIPELSAASVTGTWLNFAPAALRHGGVPPDAPAGGSPEDRVQTIAANLLCGALAGAVSRTCTAPLDRLKLIMQSGDGVGGSAYRGPPTLRGAVKDVLADGGWKAFWRGNGTNVLKIMPESGVKFMAFDMAKRLLCKDYDAPKFLERFGAGSMAGLTSQAVVYPLDIVKTRLAISPRGQYSGIGDCLAQTVRCEGIFAMYKGLGPALVGIVPAVGIDMAIYAHLKDKHRAYRLEQSREDRGGMSGGESVAVSLACGAMSSVCGACASYPLVVVRTRLMAQGMPGRPVKYKGAVDCFRTIAQEEGLRGLYRGQVPSLMKTIPSVSIGYAVYDLAKAMLGMKPL